MRPKLTYANVMSTLCFFLLLGGGAYAAGHLGRSSVGSRQLKRNAVTTAKIKNEAVTAAKIKKGTLTGAQINASTLGTVPTAHSADTANTANQLSPPESWHEVDAPGEPQFQNSWKNGGGAETVAFYKDREGVVHLKGYATLGAASKPVFQLPAGYRPAGGKELVVPVACICPGVGTGVVEIDGSAALMPELDGAVLPPTEAVAFSLGGITFRAES